MTGFPTFLAFDAQGRPHPKTVTIVMMSAAQEQKKLGLHHFYDAFSLEGKANLRQDALAQFRLVHCSLVSYSVQ